MSLSHSKGLVWLPDSRLNYWQDPHRNFHVSFLADSKTYQASNNALLVKSILDFCSTLIIIAVFFIQQVTGETQLVLCVPTSGMWWQTKSLGLLKMRKFTFRTYSATQRIIFMKKLCQSPHNLLPNLFVTLVMCGQSHANTEKRKHTLPCTPTRSLALSISQLPNQMLSSQAGKVSAQRALTQETIVAFLLIFSKRFPISMQVQLHETF